MEIENVILRAKSGDKEAFEFLYKEMYQPLFRFVLFRTRDEEKTKDIVSEVFVRFYESLDRYEIKMKPINYLMTIAMRLIINDTKKKKALALDEDAEEFIPSEEESIEDILNTEVDFSNVREIIEELGESEKDVITLKYLNDFSNSEVSEMIQKSEGNVRVIEFRALKKIRDMYNQKYAK